MLSFTLTQQQIYLLSILFPLLLLSLGLAFAVVVDTYIIKRQKRIFLVILFLVLLLIAQNYYEMLLSRGAPRIALRTFIAICGYILRPVILLLIMYLVNHRGKFLLAWILVGYNTLLYLSAPLHKLVFFISANNHYKSGPLGSTCLIVSLLLLTNLMILTIRNYRESPGREIWIPMFIVPSILFSVVLDSSVGYSEQPVTFLTITIVIACVLYFIWLHLQNVRARERDLRTQQRVQIMLSQIKPHFLYNALGAIEALCDTDPRAAKAATVKFSKYLRSNLNAISQEGAIPFEKELSHTKLYLGLEQTRFEDALQVIYRINTTDFSLPALTLEPIVENAVRHGVRGNPDGRGTVTIRTERYPDYIELSVQDNGPGFDPSRIPADGRSHIGISNVRERLERVCGGSLQIRSIPGGGTLVIIRLPTKEGI